MKWVKSVWGGCLWGVYKCFGHFDRLFSGFKRRGCFLRGWRMITLFLFGCFRISPSDGGQVTSSYATFGLLWWIWLLNEDGFLREKTQQKS